MYRLLIVDDEAIIRDGMKAKNIWREMGFTEVYTASNGKEALEVINKVNPHVVFTDIKMPVMEGLELLRNIKNRFSNIKTVILSGFNDFEYAKMGMEYGASGYILKPTTNDEIIRVFRNVIMEIGRNTADVLKYVNDKKKQKDNGLRLYNFLIGLLNGNISEEEDISRGIDEFELDICKKHIVYVLIRIDTVKKDQTETADIPVLDQKRIKMLTKNELAGIKCEMITDSSRRINLILSSEDRIKEKVIERICEIVKESTEAENDSIIVSFGFSRSYKGIGNISKAYKEAGVSLRKVFFTGLGTINKALDHTRQAVKSDIKTLKDVLISAVINGEKSKASSKLDEIFSILCSMYPDDSDKIPEIAFEILNELKYVALKKSDVLKHEILCLKDISFRTIVECRTSTELKEEVSKYFLGTAKEVSDIMNTSTNRVLISIDEYIRKKYMDKITLEEVSAVVFMNPSYISTFFKKEKGENFSDYLSRFRIERSKKLLQGHEHKIYEIARMVGYADESYFCKVFKKIEGISPFDYRSNLLTKAGIE